MTILSNVLKIIMMRIIRFCLVGVLVVLVSVFSASCLVAVAADNKQVLFDVRVLDSSSVKNTNEYTELLEQARLQAIKKWFRKYEAEDSWKCHVIFKRLPDLRKVPPGMTRVERALLGERRVTNRTILLNLDFPEVLTSVLPHEVTHAVMADAVGVPDLPRWADEGMAVLAESPSSLQKHYASLFVELRRDSQKCLFPVRELVGMKHYPPYKKLGVFYGQSFTLVEYLCSLRTTQDFIPFLRDATVKKNYDFALQKHYKIKSLEELERLYLIHLTNKMKEFDQE